MGKICDKETREYMRNYMKSWREKNPEKNRQITQRWRDNNREHISKYNHEYYLRRKALREEWKKVQEKVVVDDADK